MVKKYRVLLLIGLFLTVLSLGACGDRSSGKETFQDYTHPQVGFVVEIPNDWQKVFEDDTSTYWLNADGSLGFMVFCQLGGYSYYDENGIGDIMEKLMSKGVQKWKVVSRDGEKSLPMGWRITGQGIDKEGNVVVTDSLITEPMDAVRYYVVAVAGPKQYQEYKDTLDTIFKKFDVVATTDDIYQQMMIEKKALEKEKEEADQ